MNDSKTNTQPASKEVNSTALLNTDDARSVMCLACKAVFDHRSGKQVGETDYCETAGKNVKLIPFKVFNASNEVRSEARTE